MLYYLLFYCCDRIFWQKQLWGRKGLFCLIVPERIEFTMVWKAWQQAREAGWSYFSCAQGAERANRGEGRLWNRLFPVILLVVGKCHCLSSIPLPNSTTTSWGNQVFKYRSGCVCVCTCVYVCVGRGHFIFKQRSKDRVYVGWHGGMGCLGIDHNLSFGATLAGHWF